MTPMRAGVTGSSDRFAYEWSRYSDLDPAYEEQFLGWISPLTPHDLSGAAILDVGCGMGRNSYWAARAGAASVLACDVDEATLAVAQRTLAPLKNVEIMRCSAYDLPWRDRFDIVMAIGVVHHLEDPRRAVQKMVEATKPGGITLVWVYAREGNAGLLRVLLPLRRVTTRLPPSLTDVLSLLFSCPLYIVVRLVAWRHPYLRRMKHWRFRHVHAVVLDQLIPRISHYWTREDALGLFSGLLVSHVEAFPHNRNSWTLVAKRRADE